MSIKDFQPISKLGEGAYSSVYRVKRQQDNSEYALKKVKLMNLSEKEKENALNEVRILASVKHKNIVGYKEAFLDYQSNSLCIVMDYADNGDLYQKIVEQQKKGQLMPEEKIWGIFIQIVKGLKALHELKIYHRDLKSANVFLHSDGTVKLGDMNVSKVAKQGLLYTQTGTPYYASPEVWKDQPYDYKSDIWSLGCVLYEMTTLKPPFRAEDMEGLYKKVIKGAFPKIPSLYSQDLANIIRAMLQVQPQLRPHCERILSLPFIASRNVEDNVNAEVDDDSPSLLKTIKIPKNLHYLTDKLPKPNYLKQKLKKPINADDIIDQREHIMLPGIQRKAKQHQNRFQSEDVNESYLEKLVGQSIDQSSRREESIRTFKYEEDDMSAIQSIASKKQKAPIQQKKKRSQIKSLQNSIPNIVDTENNALKQILMVNPLKNDPKYNAIQRIYNSNDQVLIRKPIRRSKQNSALSHIDKSELSLPKINPS